MNVNSTYSVCAMVEYLLCTFVVQHICILARNSIVPGSLVPLLLHIYHWQPLYQALLKVLPPVQQFYHPAQRHTKQKINTNMNRCCRSVRVGVPIPQ